MEVLPSYKGEKTPLATLRSRNLLGPTKKDAESFEVIGLMYLKAGRM